MKRGVSSDKGQSGRRARGAFLDEPELDALESAHADGLTAAQVVDAFSSRGLKLSEATFRKYVQLGLVPRSRRVGRKGKHQGSMGLYPASAIRRVNDVKRMMSEGYTVEDIQRSFLRWTDEIDALERGVRNLLQGFEREIDASPEARRRSHRNELEAAQRLWDELVARIERLERELSLPLERAARARAFSSGASGGAGDLL